MTSTVLHTLKKCPFIRLLLPLIAGIIFQWYFQVNLLAFLLAAGVAICLFFIITLLPFAKKFSLRWLQGCVVMLLFTCLGSCIVYTKNITHQKEWMGNYYHDGDAVMITLEEPLVEKNNSYKA